MAVTLPAPVPLMIGTAVVRSGRDFSERARLLLNLLRPHLVQAYHNARSSTRLRQELAWLRRVLEDSNHGVVTLSDKDRLQFCTECAQRRSLEYFEPSRWADHLPESLQRWVKHQSSLLWGNGDVPSALEPLILERTGNTSRCGSWKIAQKKVVP